MSFVENDMRKSLVYMVIFWIDKIISLLSGITLEKVQVHSNALTNHGIVLLLA